MTQRRGTVTQRRGTVTQRRGTVTHPRGTVTERRVGPNHGYRSEAVHRLTGRVQKHHAGTQLRTSKKKALALSHAAAAG